MRGRLRCWPLVPRLAARGATGGRAAYSDTRPGDCAALYRTTAGRPDVSTSSVGAAGVLAICRLRQPSRQQWGIWRRRGFPGEEVWRWRSSWRSGSPPPPPPPPYQHNTLPTVVRRATLLHGSTLPGGAVHPAAPRPAPHHTAPPGHHSHHPHRYTCTCTLLPAPAHPAPTHPSQAPYLLPQGCHLTPVLGLQVQEESGGRIEFKIRILTRLYYNNVGFI